MSCNDNPTGKGEKEENENPTCHLLSSEGKTDRTNKNGISEADEGAVIYSSNDTSLVAANDSTAAARPVAAAANGSAAAAERTAAATPVASNGSTAAAGTTAATGSTAGATRRTGVVDLPTFHRETSRKQKRLSVISERSVNLETSQPLYESNRARLALLRRERLPESCIKESSSFHMESALKPHESATFKDTNGDTTPRDLPLFKTASSTRKTSSTINDSVAYDEKYLDEADEGENSDYTESFGSWDEMERSEESAVKENDMKKDIGMDCKDGLPWHQVQLYKMYGREEADRFLFPKIDLQQQEIQSGPRRPFHLHSITGITSSEKLWSMLREESRRRLNEIEENIAEDLKMAHRAFLQEFMQTERSRDLPYLQADSAELLKLMNETIPDRGGSDALHMVRLMYRTALKNQDQADIVLYNNPLPNIRRLSTEDAMQEQLYAGPRRYMTPQEIHDLLPPINKPASDQKQSAEIKHLQSANEPVSVTSNNLGRETDSVLEIPANYLYSIDGKNTGNSNRVEQRKRIRCVFVKESQFEIPGQFSRKIKQNEDKGVNKGRPIIEKRKVPNIPSLANPVRVNTQGPEQQSGTSVREKRSSVKKEDPWQPLTLSALLDYALKYKVKGHQSHTFNNSSTWNVV